MVEQIEEILQGGVLHAASITDQLRVAARQDAHGSGEAHEVDLHPRGSLFGPVPRLNLAGGERPANCCCTGATLRAQGARSDPPVLAPATCGALNGPPERTRTARDARVIPARERSGLHQDPATGAGWPFA